MNNLSPCDICVNHTLAVTKSEFSISFLSELVWKYDFGEYYGIDDKIKPWHIIKRLLEKPKIGEAKVEAHLIDNIPDHATVLGILTKNGKKVIFYYNPWGYNGDNQHTNTRYVGMPEIVQKGIDHVSSRNLLDETFTTTRTSKPSSVLGIMNLKVRKFISRLPPHRQKQIETDFDEWSAYEEGHWNKCHVVSTIMLLKLFYGLDHLVVLNPSETMEKIGTQMKYNDGISEATDEYLEERPSYGACGIWTTLYRRRAMELLEPHLETNKPLSYFIDIIKNKLSSDLLEENQTARERLALFMFEDMNYRENYTMSDKRNVIQILRPILKQIYLLIPEKSPTPMTRFAKKYPMKTAWHKDVFGRLNKIIEEFRGIEDGPAYIPAFYQVLNIISKKESDTHIIQKIVSEIERRDYMSFEFLDEFISMVTILIICKHEESVPGMDVPDLICHKDAKFTLPPLTRHQKRTLDEIGGHDGKRTRL